MAPLRCHYEVLEVERTVTDDELKVAYRRLARQWHPDKNLDQSEFAEEKFKELRAAYEVLSDPNERAWYDSHREAILAGGDGTNTDRKDGDNLWGYFSNSCYSGYGDDQQGFYSIYRDVFEQIDKEELEAAPKQREAPRFGDSTSSYTEHVRVFYAYWVNFTTAKSFAWKDVYNTTQAPNRDVRRVMEKENKKERDKAKKEYVELVRRLAEYTRKKDPRVMNWVKSQAAMKAEEEVRKKKDQEKIQAQVQSRKAAAKAAQQDHLDSIDLSSMDASEIMSEKDLKKFKLSTQQDQDDEQVEDIYCPACKKVFKSDKQWKNHENSKKHKEAAVKLRNQLLEEERAMEQDEIPNEESLDAEEQYLKSLDDLHHHSAFQSSKIQSKEEEDEQVSSEDDDVDVNISAVELEHFKIHQSNSEVLVDAQSSQSQFSPEAVQTTSVQDNDDMLLLLAKHNRTPAWTSAHSDDESSGEAAIASSSNSQTEKDDKKAFKFSEFEVTMNQQVEGQSEEVQKKKRRRAVKSPKVTTTVPAQPTQEDWEFGTKKSKGKKNPKGHNVTIPDHACRTCGASFPSNTTLHAHLKQTKHSISQ